MSAPATTFPSPTNVRVRLGAPVTIEDAGRRVDPYTFALIVQRDRSIALALAQRICGSRGLAEEVVQEALLAVWRDQLRYDPSLGTTRTWLLRIVRNRAIDALRHERARHGRNVSDDDAAQRVPGTVCIGTEAEVRDLETRVRYAIDRIPAEQRHALQLAYLDDLTHTEIAELLGLAPGTVKGRIRLGLTKLRALPEFAPTAITAPRQCSRTPRC